MSRPPRVLASRPVRNPEGRESTNVSVDDVAGIHLAIGECQVVADDQDINGAVRIRQLIADAVGGEAGIVANRDASLDVAVKKIGVIQNKGAEIIRDAQSGCGHITAFQLGDTQTKLASPLLGMRAAQPCDTAGESR